MKVIDTRSMNSPSKKLLQKKACMYLSQAKFKEAFALFEQAFWLDTSDLDSRIGLYLSDVGLDFGSEAMGIYEFYQSSLAYEPRSNRRRVQKMILQLISAFDNKTHHLSQTMQDSKKAMMESYDAINYSDIKEALNTKDFKEVYSSLCFNTKIIFTHKGDFYEFLSLLIENDYLDISLSYIDSLPRYDMDIIPIIEQASKKINGRLSKKIKKNSNTDNFADGNANKNNINNYIIDANSKKKYE
ncbi:hypothetical protein [Helicobacter muridarum]|uniref:Two-component sensor kinase CzcS n=1 Tax=Helicobacter muridarum TaxID=216 RepID=A0A377PTP1_9HELI|nr:hypothetical protein [Helicobacter muridarum]STQ85890.1 Two-component sensor kinase CzcS [Helicobacter muridarum]